MAGQAPRRTRVPPDGTAAALDGHQPRPGSAPGRKFAIVAARFNESITSRLVEGARHAFAAGGIPADAVELHWVPGSFELPLGASSLAATGRYRGIVCVGVVIRGETPHFEQVALATGVPTTFGVVTALDESQAWARAGGGVANRGEEAAEAALEMAEFVERLRDRRDAPAGRSTLRARHAGPARGRRG